ncbi:MAG: hypothetical protein AB7G68_14895 [Nitrospiraceae bacterium]
MADLLAQQAKFREKRREQSMRRKDLYDARQSLQLVRDEIGVKLRATGATTLPASDPLSIKQAELVAAMPALQQAVTNAEQAVRGLFDELYTDRDFQTLLADVPGDAPFLLLPVRLETRFCRTRYFAKPVSKDWLLDFSQVNAPGAPLGWGVQESPEGIALQVRAPFPEGANEALFNAIIGRAIQSGNLKPANGRWLQRKPDSLELRIRILPDDIHIDSFEENLAPEEVERGKQFWQRVWKGDKPEAAWDELRSFFSTPRSAWVVRQTRPLNFVDEGTLPAKPQFPELKLRANSYTQAPVAAALPDFFTAILHKVRQPERLVKGQLVSPDVVTGFDPDEPDPSAFEPDQDGNLKFPEALRWIFNFEEAEKKGLAIRVPLNEFEFATGFDKLVVLGVKLSAGQEEGKELLEHVFQSHLYEEKGMHVLPQGTPTNNFESVKSGYNRPEQEAARYFKATWKGGHAWSDAQRTDPLLQPDGLRLTEALGIGADFSRRLPGADGEDVREAMAMNRLLYPGTLGYWLRQFFSPPLLEAQLDALQDFFEQFVSGRGLLPAIRIGRQPYGILPATAFKFWKSKNPQDFPQVLFEVVLKKLDGFWEGLKGDVLFAGDGRVTADQLSEDLMRLAGYDPASSRFTQQALFGEGHLNFMLRLNLFQYLGLAGGGILKNPPTVNQFQGQVEPELREKLWELGDFAAFRFMHAHPKKRRLDGPVIEDLPLSESRSLQKFSGSTWNYLDWLLHSSVEELWKEQFQRVPLAQGAPAAVPPKALLYHFARFALRRGALDNALRLLEPDEKLRILKTRDLELLALLSDAGAEFTPASLNDQNLIQRTLKPLVQRLGIQGTFFLTPNRFSYFEQAIGSPARPVKDILQEGAATGAAAFADQRQAVSVLKDLATARLERLFCEHLDLCSYRLDAWFQALPLERLSRRRAAPASQGMCLGAFGFLEKVRPAAPASFVQEVEPVFATAFDVKTACLPLVNTRQLQAAGQDVDKLLANSFVYLGNDPSHNCRFDVAKRRVVMQVQPAPGNHGFIHAPSPEHADTAAILRAAWIGRQAGGDNDPGTLAVRLDSPRVRGALALLEGIGQGDSLAALLGYQLERKLHDARLDPLIFKVRRLFPFKTDQPPNVFAATTDGMAVIQAWQSSPGGWGGTSLSGQDRQHIEPLLVDLQSQFDALSDLLLTESVFQTVKGSPGRAAAALRTLNASGQVHNPEVVQTPQRGSLVVFRTGIVFPGNNFLGKWGPTLTPKAAASPKLNNWMAGQLPNPTRVIVTAIPAGGAPQKLKLSDLDVQPLDLMAMFPEPNAKVEEASHLAWLAESLARKKLALPAGASVTIDFASRAVADANELTIGEIAPLVHQLAQLSAAARPVTAVDFLREGGQGAAPAFNAAAIQQAFVKMVKTERQPETLSRRIAAAQADLEAGLAASATSDRAQAAWSALLDALAEGARWLVTNRALGMRRIVDIEQSQLLLQTAARTAADLQRMQADADTLIAELVAAPPAGKYAICERVADRLFGKSLRLCPVVQLTNVPVVKQAQAADLSQNLDLLSLENWQCQSALVHPVFRLYRQCALLREALAAPAAEQELTILQFNSPTAATGFWIGAEMRGAPPNADISQSFGGTLSFALELPKNWNPATALSGLVFDEWTEMLPSREATTGVAFHFNQPDTEPPQVILLAVCPAEGENWRWEYLTETILDIFERARKRLIDFDHVKSNAALAHVLPAVVAPLDRDNLSANLDLGRNQTDVPLDANGGAPIVSL